MAAGKKVHLPGNEVGFLYTGWLHWQCEAANRLRAPTLFIGKWYFDNILVATVTREKPPQPKTPYCLHQVMMYEGLEGSFRGGKWDSTLMWPDRWKPGGESSYNFQLQHTLCHSDQFCWSQWTRVWEFNKKISVKPLQQFQFDCLKWHLLPVSSPFCPSFQCIILLSLCDFLRFKLFPAAVNMGSCLMLPQLHPKTVTPSKMLLFQI